MEEKRKIISSHKISSGTIDVLNQDTFLNTDKTITTRVGEVFTITENPKSNNSTDGFSSLWGDQDTYLAKLQLYIRGRFEQLYKDFSLRDNCAVSSSIPLDKHWFPFDYGYRNSLSELATTVLFTNR